MICPDTAILEAYIKALQRKNKPEIEKKRDKSNRKIRKAEQGKLINNDYLGIKNQKRKNTAEGLKRIQEAAAKGYADAHFQQRKNTAEVLKRIQEAAAKGYADAQFQIGLAYSNGDGVPENSSLAVVWFQKAAVQGYADAQFQLGCAYYYGQGVTEDCDIAARWFRKAAEQGHIDAQFHFGHLYWNGEGVPKDIMRAYFWFSLSSSGSMDEHYNDADKAKAAVAKLLDSGQLLKAKNMIRDWEISHLTK